MATKKYEQSETDSPNLTLIRHWNSNNEVRGTLYVNDQQFGTLENKMYIFPDGQYPLKYEHSPKFKRKLWELKDINGRSEIKIHHGANISDTRGCILLTRKNLNHLHTHLHYSKTYILSVQTKHKKITLKNNKMRTLLEKLLDALIKIAIRKLEELMDTDLNQDGKIG